MKNSSTLLLRLIVLVVGGIVTAFTGLLSYAVARNWAIEFPEFSLLQYPLAVILLLSLVPFGLVLFQIVKLLGYIDKNKAFSKLSVRAVKSIKYNAFFMGVLYALLMPAVFAIAESDDAPGLILVGMAFVCVPIAISVFAGVVQGLFQSAIDIKSENDLTV